MRSAILLACLGFAPPLAAQDSARVVLAATADVQGQLTGWDDAFERPHPGGLTRAATVFDSLRRRHPDQLIVADVGNARFGAPLASHLAAAPRDPDPVVEAQNLAGVDVATLSAHDLHGGIAPLRRAIRGARFPLVAAAPLRLAGDSLALPPHVVLRRGPLRIAVTGAATVPLDPAALRALRAEADFVVVLARGEVFPGGAATALGGADAPDLVVLGGPAIPEPAVERPHLARPGPQGRSVSVTHLVARRERGRWRLAEARTELVATAEVRENPRVAARLTGVHEELTAALRQVIATANGAFPGRYARVEAVPAQALLLDAMRARTGAPLAVAPAVRASAGLPDGDVRRADVVGLYPFDHVLLAIRITGAQLRDHLEQSARWYAVGPGTQVAPDPAVPAGSFDVLGGAAYEIDLTQPPGRRVQSLLVGGRELGPADSVTVALPADRAARFPGAPIVHDRGERLRDVLVEEVARQRTLAPATFAERTWRLVPEPLAASARARLDVPAAVAAPRQRPDSIALRILSINDFHAALEPTTEPDGTVLGGIAALDATMDSAAARCRCPTLRLDAGDALQGSLGSTLDQGRTVLRALGTLGLAAGALGNHEFDWGTDTLRARLRESAYPWLAANVVDSATGRRVPWVRSHLVLSVGGLRVGLIGYMTRHFKRVVMARHTRGLDVREGAAAIRDVLDSLRAQRPDLVVLVAHEGGACDGRNCRGDVFELAEQLGKGSVDVIVSGHSHTVIADDLGSVPIVQAGSHGRSIGIADVIRRPEGGWRVAVRVQRVVPQEVTPDAALAELVYQANRSIAKLASRPVARLQAPLRRGTGVESPLGDFVADAHRNVGRGDIAIMNRGGVRADLDAGEVTYGELVAVAPFGNRLVAVELSGAEVRALLERMLADPERRDFVSGLVVRFDPSRRTGDRVREVRLADDRTLEDDRRYRVIVNEYIATNQQAAWQLQGRPQQDAGMSDIEALELYLRRLPQPVTAPSTGRFVVAK